MENTSTKKIKTLSIAELWFVFKKNLLWEFLICVVGVLGGLIFALTSKPTYLSTANVIVTASFEDKSSINDTTLARYYIDTVISLFSDSEMKARANNLLNDPEFFKREDTKKFFEYNGKDYGFVNVYEEEGGVPAHTDFIERYGGVSNTSASSAANSNNFIITVSCVDGNFTASRIKLHALRVAIKNFCEGENGERPFSATVYVNSYDIPNARLNSARRRNTVIYGGVAGVGIAVVYLLLMYFVMDKVSSSDRLEMISGVKNIMTVEKIKSETNTADPSEHKHLSLDLKKLADNLIYLQDGENNKVFQIQSAVSGEGKTTIATNLAMALGESQRKTLIIDGDFSKPSIHRTFRLHREKGITDYFKGTLDFDGIVKKTGVENVDLITCGDRISNHTIFFASDKFKAIIKEAREKYDFVLIDCAPVKALSDYINISSLVDSTILVVKSDVSSSRDIQYTVRELESCGANVLGTVFNFSTEQKKKKYYYYYYHHKHDETTKQ